MLLDLDEYFLHQAPLTFSQTTTSDHRFYDRCFVTALDSNGKTRLAMSLGVYKNMNVIDGFLCVRREGRQYNVRVSRMLRPKMNEFRIGPLCYEIVKPMRELRIRLEHGDHGFSCDLSWTGTIAPFLEQRWAGTTTSINERVVSDVQRYEQAGKVDGWITIGGERLAVKEWWGGRDHSWGVRAGVGGFEPYNGPDTTPLGGSQPLGARQGGTLLSWFLFSCGDMAGYVSRTENAEGKVTSVEGQVGWESSTGRSVQKVIRATLDAHFPMASRYYDRASMEFTIEDGSNYRVEIRDVDGIICKGGGYNQGWNDGKGLGIFRGLEYTEHDVYEDTDDPMEVRIVGGGKLRHNQREQLVPLTINGQPGFGDCTVIAYGDLKHLDFPKVEPSGERTP